MKKANLFLIVLLFLSTSSFCQTLVSGGIFTNTIWSPSGSPYIVTGDIVVMSNVTLTISPGVVVRFMDGVGMEVRGELLAVGTATDSIEFTSDSNNPTKGIWSNINYWNDLLIAFVKISYAYYGLYSNHSAILNVSNCRFFRNFSGISGIGNGTGGGSIYNSLFDENNEAIGSASEAGFISNSSFINNVIGIGYAYNVLISNNTFIGHTNKAIDGYGANYIGNTFTDNNIALRLKLFSSNYEIRDNIIAHNQIGIKIRGDATSTLNTGFYNNEICYNAIHNAEVEDNISVYLENNCWCTTNTTDIANSIYDAYENLSLGLAYFSPFDSSCTTGIEGTTEIKNTTWSPNPFHDFCILKFDNLQNQKCKLLVYSIQGSLVRTISDLENNQIRIERENLNSGIYFFQLCNDFKSIANGKLILE